MKHTVCFLFLLIAFKSYSQNPCNPNITYTISPIDPLKYTFTFNGSTGTCFWGIGDFTLVTETDNIITYTFSEPGYYTVLAFDIGQPICPDSLIVPLIVAVGDVSGLGCTANFHIQTDFNIAAHSCSNPALNAFWIINGQQYTGRSVPLGQMTDEIIDICLLVSDTNGVCTDSTCQTITNFWNVNDSVGLINGTVYLFDTIPGALEPATDGTAYLYSVNHSNTSNFGVMVASAPLDSAGNYEFDNIPFGVYKVRAALNVSNPAYLNYVPTYYPYSEYWLPADSVLLNAVNSYPFANIVLLPMYYSSGNGNVNGTIIISDTVRSASAEDVTVILQDTATFIGSYMITGADGTFSFANIADGTYLLSADKCGFFCTPQLITIDANNQTVNDIQIELFPEIVLSTTEVPAIIKTATLFPNPSINNTMLVLESEANSQLHISILNTVGQQVLASNVNLEKGMNQFTLATGSLPTGIYMVVMTDKSSQTTCKKLVHY